MNDKRKQRKKGSDFLEKQISRLGDKYFYRLSRFKYRYQDVSRNLVALAISRTIHCVVSSRLSSEKIQRLEMIS